MVEWLKRLVVGEGNVIRERAYTNWNTLDVEAIIAEKTREAHIAADLEDDDDDRPAQVKATA